jgi:hypothetical protein
MAHLDEPTGLLGLPPQQVAQPDMTHAKPATSASVKIVLVIFISFLLELSLCFTLKKHFPASDP